EADVPPVNLGHVHAADRANYVAFGAQPGEDAHQVAALLQPHVIHGDVRRELGPGAYREICAGVVRRDLDDRFLELEARADDEVIALLGIVDQRGLDVHRVVKPLNHGQVDGHV